jgi:peptidoglycan/LPS O-acetylase OafA/YrhL
VIASMGRPVGLILGILTIAFLQINGQMPAIGSVIGFIIIAFIADYIPIIAAGIRSIGRVSYFMYFMHFYVLWVASLALRRIFKTVFGPGTYPEPILAFFILATTAVVVSWAIGQLSWRYFESPINRRAQQFHTKLTQSKSEQPTS